MIVGFRNESEILNLVRRNKIAGVYFTSRNVHNKTKDEIKEFIQKLQDERSKYSENKLLIMADQEGGIVSHLSPPLTKTISIKDAWQNGSMLEIADIHGQEMKELGFNINLGPVADLDSAYGAGGYSQISSRSVSGKASDVNEAAKQYCMGLSKYKISCTLKHFPGIGEVPQDTHFELGRIEKDYDDLSYQTSAFTSPGVDHYVMFSHVLITSIDPDHPASVSQKVVKYFKEINQSAKIITDDISMLPISKNIGTKKAYLQSIEAGVDYVLISYDKDLIYLLSD